MEDKAKKLLEKSLYKLASGFEYTEVVEEYCMNKDNQMEISKKKISSHYIQPDIVAIRLLLELSNQNISFSNMTDEELIEMKDRLIKELDGGEK